MVMWSGPGRALQAHLDLYDRVSTASKRLSKPEIRRSDLYNDLTAYQHAAILTSINMGAYDAKTGEARPDVDIFDGEAGVGHRDVPSRIETPENISKTRATLRLESDMLNAADTLYVSHHVSESVRQAAEVADPEPLFPTDLPSPDGLIVLEHPLILWDLAPDTGKEERELLMPIRMIGWTTQRVSVNGRGSVPGVVLFLYTDRESFEQYYVQSMIRLYPERADEVAGWQGVFTLPTWTCDLTGWAFGEKWETGASEDHDEIGTIVPSMSLVRRFFLALMRWCWQRILVPEYYKPGRAEHRRWMRAEFTGEPHIKVLRLRRFVEAEARGEDTTGWSATHQWIVRGHWRRQHYPSLGPARHDDGSFNHDSHRLVWIEAHLAGNPAGALHTAHHVTAAVR